MDQSYHFDTNMRMAKSGVLILQLAMFYLKVIRVPQKK